MTTAAAALAAMVAGNAGACLGIAGSGKTTAAAAAVAGWPRVVVFDPYAARDRSAYNRGRTNRKPWFPSARLVSVDELLRHPEILDRSPLRLVAYSAKGELDDNACGRDFSALARLLWATEGIDLVAEEVGRYGRQAVQMVNAIATGGAHAGMRMLLVCQSMGRIPIDGRKALSIVAAGAQGSPEDLDALQSRCGPAFRAAAAKLRAPPHVSVPDAPIVWRLGDALES